MSNARTEDDELPIKGFFIRAALIASAVGGALAAGSCTFDFLKAAVDRDEAFTRFNACIGELLPAETQSNNRLNTSTIETEQPLGPRVIRVRDNAGQDVALIHFAFNESPIVAMTQHGASYAAKIGRCSKNLTGLRR